ncbi:hypothetical protein Tco_1476354 [Tanacetum coccineum]
MVAYLKKPEGNKEFHQIVDFLNASHIRYALTENPTIYVSLIKQFWETATARTLDTGEVELTVTIDGKVKIVTKASIRRHLQLADSDGSTHTVESHHTPTSAPSTSQPPISPTSKRTIRQASMVPQLRSPTQTHVADEAASTGVDVRYGGAATTKVESLETNLKQTKLTYGAAYTKLIKKVKKLENKVKSNQARRRARIIISDDEEDLEDPFKQSRKVFEIDQDPTISLVQHDAEIQGRQEHDMEFEFDLDASKDVSTAEEDISTAKTVSTAGATITTASVDVSTATVSTAKDKAELEEEERQRIANVQEVASSFNIEEWDDIQARVEADEEYFAAQKAEERRNKPPTQAQQRTYMSNYIKHIGAYTLQQLRSYSFDEIKILFETTMRRVQTFVPMDSEIERAIPESTAGSSKRDAEEELAQESSKRQKTGESSVSAEEPKDKEEELSQERLQQMMIIVPEQGMNVEALQTKEDLVKLWSLVKEKFNSTEPTEDKEREIWVELKRLFEPDTDDELWKLQKYIHDLTWRLYDSCGVHHVSTEKGIDIYMLIEKEYPLSRGTLTQMLVAKLLVEQDNEMSRELLRKIFMQNIRVILHSIHSDDGNPSSANIKQALRTIFILLNGKPEVIATDIAELYKDGGSPFQVFKMKHSNEDCSIKENMSMLVQNSQDCRKARNHKDTQVMMQD